MWVEERALCENSVPCKGGVLSAKSHSTDEVSSFFLCPPPSPPYRLSAVLWPLARDAGRGQGHDEAAQWYHCQYREHCGTGSAALQLGLLQLQSRGACSVGRAADRACAAGRARALCGAGPDQERHGACVARRHHTAITELALPLCHPRHGAPRHVQPDGQRDACRGPGARHPQADRVQQLVSLGAPLSLVRQGIHRRLAPLLLATVPT